MVTMENRLFDELSVGDSASLTRCLTREDIDLFAAVSGDVNPAHLDTDYAKASVFHDVIGHGMWCGSLISAVLGVKLPGPGTIYLSQSIEFHEPIRIGDEIRVDVRVTDKSPPDRVTFDCDCRNQHGEVVVSGKACVLAPRQKINQATPDKPTAFIYEQGHRLKRIVEEAQSGDLVDTGIIHPVNAVTLSGVKGAMDAGLIRPVLIGPAHKIKRAAREADFPIDGIEMIDAPHSHAAAAQAVAMARDGELDALMKGALHTDEVMSEVVSSKDGIRTERRISHIYVMDTPAYNKLLFITDAAINISPNLDCKRDIAQNAIDLALTLGIDRPKLAVLSAVESVTSKIPSTMDAAALCKMADRGQITGGMVDGPLAFDNAISPSAVEMKGINSSVAGSADILLVPGLEAGNMLSKQLDYLAGAVAAGVVLGAKTPIILTSRAEGTFPRIAASAIAKLYLQKAGSL